MIFFRYDDAPQEDVFEQLIREADEREKREKQLSNQEDDPAQISNPDLSNSQTQQEAKPSLTEEQRERMLKNRQMALQKAEERKRRKLEEQNKTLENSQPIVNNDGGSAISSQ